MSCALLLAERSSREVLWKAKNAAAGKQAWRYKPPRP